LADAATVVRIGWIYFCVAANSSGYERVTDDDAGIMLSTPWGPDLKAFIKAWFREHYFFSLVITESHF
jgi:hypothetical protein